MRDASQKNILLVQQRIDGTSGSTNTGAGNEIMPLVGSGSPGDDIDNSTSRISSPVDQSEVEIREELFDLKTLRAVCAGASCDFLRDPECPQKIFGGKGESLCITLIFEKKYLNFRFHL